MQMKSTRIVGFSLAHWLLSAFSDDRYHISIAGDCEELWRDIAELQGRWQAHRWLWSQVLLSIPLFLIDSLAWSLSMFRNYFKTTFRHLKKHKGYAAINIIGLAIGLAATMLILMWVQDELSYDRFHEKLPRLYRAFTHQVYSGQVFNFRDTPAPLSAALESEFPEVERAITLLVTRGGVVEYNDRRFDEDAICFASSGFFDLFTFPLIKGEVGEQFKSKSSIMITEETAEKYFGDDSALGKVLRFGEADFEVSGVLKNIPRQSHLQFDFVLPFENSADLAGINLENWYSNWPSTYILLKQGADATRFAAKIEGVIKAHAEHSAASVWMQPVSRTWLYRLTGEKAGMHYVQIFSAVAFFVLLIACINFMNLSTAKAANRAKEVGLRKVFGAFRQKLIIQFYSESIILAVLALGIALLLVVIGLPLFNQLSGKEMSLTILKDVEIWGLFLAITLLTGVVAGSYPALVLSAFKPASILGRRFTSSSGGVLFRRVLVIVQFTLSVALVIGTSVVREQIRYIQAKDLGYDNKNLLVLRLRGEGREKYSVFKTELLKLSGVEGVTGTDKLPIYGGNSTASYNWDGKDPEFSVLINQVRCDFDYINEMGMTMALGRDYSRHSSGDIGHSYILNETAIQRMGLDDPVGKIFGKEGRMGSIVGVVKDYHFANLQNEIEPLVMMVDPERIQYLLVRLDADEIAAGQKAVEATWNHVNPNFDFESRFLEDVMSFFSTEERQTEQIIAFFTVLAIVISCLGLFGLAAFMAQKRAREIGIRRVLGASTQGLVYVMSREFIVLVVTANVVAWPAAFFMMNRWLNNYAYHTTMSWSLFVVAGISSIGIAFLTVSFQSIKAALMNPAKSLQCE
ncbi:ABC transporter permease [bacterium]|nr:ABC transporter permease [bacterium]